MKRKLIIVSGYFNPLHRGHIEYFHSARQYADKLIVIVNNDNQRKKKGTKKFMSQEERLIIISELRVVDYAELSIDNDRTVIKTISKIYDNYHDKYQIFFGNGGDQNNRTIPEDKICKDLNIKLVDGLGEKIQSSSWLIDKNEN